MTRDEWLAGVLSGPDDDAPRLVLAAEWPHLRPESWKLPGD